MGRAIPCVPGQGARGLSLPLNTVVQGDCLDVMRSWPDGCVDAVVTDPPYGLGFMGKAWDSQVPSVEVWQQVFRVLKDGGRLLAFGGTRTYHRLACNIEDAGFVIEDMMAWLHGSGFPKHRSKLKPAHEPICVARKGSVSQLQIDAARLPYENTANPATNPLYRKQAGYANGNAPDNGITFRLRDGTGERNPNTGGRWPANVMLDEDAAAMLDAQTGTLRSGGYPPAGGLRSHVSTYGAPGVRGEQVFGSSSGGASRFYYCAKASRGEREAGCELLLHGNNHPTVKPIALMRHLIKITVAPGGLVLDPFCGSGTTLIASEYEGMSWLGLELDGYSCEISRARVEHAARLHALERAQPDLFEAIPA